MTDETKGRRRGLGRGLSALLGDEAGDYVRLDQVRASKVVSIEHLRPNTYQPRQRFGETELESLVESIREVGVLQPILVRRTEDPEETFEIVAGERRWRAAQRAQLHQVPVVIKELDDSQSLKISLVENIQREDLNAIEEGEAYNRLMEEFGLTQEAVSLAVGRSRSHVANTVRLLGLPETVRSMLAEGLLTAGHARALLTSSDPEGLAKRVVSNQMTVRDVERLAQDPGAAAGNVRQPPRPKSADTIALERNLSATLGLHVSVAHKASSGGTVKINYKTLEQLDEVCRRLCHHAEDSQSANLEQEDIGLEQGHLGPEEEDLGPEEESLEHNSV